MVFSWLDTDALALNYIISSLICVKHHDLVGALASLALSVEHKTASEDVDFAHVSAGSVAAATLQLVVIGSKIDVFPHRASVEGILMEVELSYFLVCLVIQSAYKEQAVIAGGQSGVLSWSRHPVLAVHDCNIGVE